MENGIEQSFETRTMIHLIHPVLLSQDINCHRIKWIEDSSGEGEWKCLEQKRNGIASILSIEKEREKIPRENINYFIYLPCTCPNSESCSYVPNMKTG